jgi:L-2-hydroxycarboxylate dehydrogenase (NAD+)
MQEKFFDYTYLLNQAVKAFLKMGCSQAHAELAAKVLLQADLRGIDSHGLARLSGYLRLHKADRINAKPNISIVHQTPSTATLNGDAGLGLVVAPKAMEIAMEKAEQVGSGWVAVSNSNHFGIAGYHAMMALSKNMIGIALTNASPLVAPTFSTERMLGTNPIAIAVPAKKNAAFVADMATTTAANGKLEILQRKQQATPSGWVQNEIGEKSTDAFAVKHGGALLPLGSQREQGSHKGYALGAMVDILSGVLSGANYGPWVPPFVSFLQPLPNLPGQGLGHFFGAMRIDAFRPAEDFLNHMDNWIDRFKQSKPIDKNQKVIIPGEPEAAMEAERLKNGIPIIQTVINDLEEIGFFI